MSISRCAAVGASMFAFAMTPGAAMAAGGRGSPARAARGSASPGSASPGSGYRQAAGSRRVRELQRRLAGLGFAPGPIDGRYGLLTTRAVISFQAAQGLGVDGVAGPKTLTQLRVLASGGSLTHALGARRENRAWVRGLQLRLVRLDYRPGPTDGVYGPLTARALTRYLRAEARPQAARSARLAPARGSEPAAPRVHVRPSALAALARASRSPAATTPSSSPTPIATRPASGDQLGFWLLLVGLAAAGVLVAGAALGGRPRTLRRRRRHVSPRMLAVARRAGFHYSEYRDAYVLRLIGNRFGPVLKPHPRPANANK